MRRTLLAIPLLLGLAACKTSGSDDWTGGAQTPFGQAERSCTELLDTISREEDRREFFIGCMGALGWTPRPGASIDL
jgi:hypothetical protein